MSQFAHLMSAPLSGVSLSASLWSIIYGAVHNLPIFKERTFGYKTRVVAIFHAFTTLYLAVHLSFLRRPLEIGGENTAGQTTVVNVAGGFFLYDIISWIIYGYLINKYDWAQLFHHAACLIGMSACWTTGRSGADCSMALFVAELANPFMYLRYLLREVGWKDTTLARTNQAIFALAMTITIPILSPILAVLILMEPRSHPLHQLAAVGLVAVNLMWFFKFMTKYWTAASVALAATAPTTTTTSANSSSSSSAAVPSFAAGATGAGGVGKPNGGSSLSPRKASTIKLA